MCNKATKKDTETKFETLVKIPGKCNTKGKCQRAVFGIHMY